MKIIYKYSLSAILDGHTDTIVLPSDAELLHVGTQNEQEPNLWALVDTDKKLEERKFVIYGTGHPIDSTDNLTYVGTFMLHKTTYVFHLFEKIEVKEYDFNLPTEYENNSDTYLSPADVKSLGGLQID